jgi:hypothetical protein
LKFVLFEVEVGCCWFELELVLGTATGKLRRLKSENANGGLPFPLPPLAFLKEKKKISTAYTPPKNQNSPNTPTPTPT